MSFNDELLLADFADFLLGEELDGQALHDQYFSSRVSSSPLQHALPAPLAPLEPPPLPPLEPPLPPPQQLPAAPALEGSNAAINDNAHWAWLSQQVPNETGTYYSYSAKPGGINRIVSDMGPGEAVYTRHMVNQAFEQKAELTMSHLGTAKLAEMVAVICARLGVPLQGGSNRAKARWIIAREMPLHALGVGVGVPVGFVGGAVVPTDWFLGQISGGVLVLGASTEAAVQ